MEIGLQYRIERDGTGYGEEKGRRQYKDSNKSAVLRSVNVENM